MRDTLASLVEDWQHWDGGIAVASHRGNRVFRTSYRQMAEMAGRFAAELERRGIVAGERVVLWGENSPEWIAAFFGCMLRGVLAVPLDLAGTPAFAARVVADVSPRLVVGDAASLARLETAEPQVAFAAFAEALPMEPLLARSEAVVEAAPFQIVFTSGTTSEPKGVLHTHQNVLASLRPIEAEIARYRRYERWVHPLRLLHTLPFSHVFGQFMGLWIPALLGAELHLPESVEPGGLIRVAKRERISVLVAVPRVLELLRARVRGQWASLDAELEASAGIPAWKRWWRFRGVHAAFGYKFWAFVCGGATLPPDLEAFWNGLGFALVQGYGMTETAALVTLNHPFKVGRGTLGKTLPGREVRLSAEGEILVRGDMLAAGAWQGGRFHPRAEEWLATGDLATRDAAGELRFAGRRGDVIVTGAGMNVHPGDVEAALLRRPGMRACAVVACEGANGPEPVGVVLFSGDDAGLRHATERANADLAPHQQLRRVLRWPDPSLPYTSTGKLLRRRVADWVCAQLGSAARTAYGGGTGVDPLRGLVEEITGDPSLAFDDESRLTEDLHLDSLGRVQLQSALQQRFGVEVRDEDLGALQTVGELRSLAGTPRETAGATRETAAAAAGSPPSVPEGWRGASAGRVAYPRWPWSAPVRWLRGAFLACVAMPLVRLLADPQVPEERAVADRGPMLVVANHVNTYDLPLLLYALRDRRRWLATAMSAEVLDDLRQGRGKSNGLLRLLARPAYWLLLGLFNVFPLPRSSGFRESFAHAGEALDRGYSVLVFPEGRRSGTGELQPFRPGIGLLVGASQVPVLPVALQGMGTTAREGRSWFRSRRVGVRFGEPLVFPPGTRPEEITRLLEEAVLALGPS